jgi:hypothetical protein
MLVYNTLGCLYLDACSRCSWSCMPCSAWGWERGGECQICNACSSQPSLTDLLLPCVGMLHIYILTMELIETANEETLFMDLMYTWTLKDCCTFAYKVSVVENQFWVLRAHEECFPLTLNKRHFICLYTSRYSMIPYAWFCFILVQTMILTTRTDDKGSRVRRLRIAGDKWESRKHV